MEIRAKKEDSKTDEGDVRKRLMLLVAERLITQRCSQFRVEDDLELLLDGRCRGRVLMPEKKKNGLHVNPLPAQWRKLCSFWTLIQNYVCQEGYLLCFYSIILLEDLLLNHS